ncbi:protein PTHB1 [Battus philenor]|uniref:protein PTHB1 n=1 Tax=Battus philenor TaxID=42288 RepID=UPI0035D1206B
MSLFKVNKWWSNEKLHNTGLSATAQNIKCVKIDKFNSHNDSDCIMLGESTLLKLYKPSLNQDSLLLETDLGDFVLQVETGKFIGTSGEREIIILHPQSYVIYEFQRKGGLSDAGDQNNIVPLVSHSFKRRAYSLILGPFGSSKSRDLICVQSLDGTLSFFDQDTFLFMCIFNDILIPGPLAYVANSDLFVICKSTWILEIYSYQQLRESSELSLRQNQNSIPQWTYNAGEEISALQVIRTSTNFSSIIALGERHLYCFQDNGLMKDLIRFNYSPICFYSYLIGWYYEPGARLLVMVASDDSKLYIYEGITLLWACDLMINVVTLSRCFLNSLPGGIVTLATNGVLTVSYLGTEPDLNPSVNLINEVVDPEQVQNELESIEDTLKKIMDDDKGINGELAYFEKTIGIKIEVGQIMENVNQTNYDSDEVLLFCPVLISLTCQKPALIQSIQMTFILSSPFAATETIKFIDGINIENIFETNVFLSNGYDIPDANAKILFTIVNNTGKIIILHRNIMLPLSLYCNIDNTILDSKLQLSIHVNHPCTEFENIFTELSTLEMNSNSVTFKYTATNNIVTLRAAEQEYSIESNDFPEMTSILDYFIYKLNEYYISKNIGISITLTPSKEFIDQLIHRLLKCIENHSKERIKLNKLEDELNILQKQFIIIQKKLLVQYGSLPPGNCDPLEFLMKDTHTRLTKNVNEIIQNRDVVCRAGNILAAVERLVICILRNTSADTLKVKLIEEMLSFEFLHDDFQEWEEAVSKISSFVSNKLFQKSEKDKEKLAPLTEQEILSHINLKRFLKQMKTLLERVFEGVNSNSQGKGIIIRTEELVEVI